MLGLGVIVKFYKKKVDCDVWTIIYFSLLFK